MRMLANYPVIVTDKVKACRDFYVRYLDFEVIFEASWFVYLKSEEGCPAGIAFMSPDHPSHPPSPRAYDGNGMFLTLQVENAEKALERLTNFGAPIVYPLKVELWGQRRFGLTDPSGLWVDIVEQVEPQAGFWDQYIS
jgi:uncharacterized glyoxalase superfamily protein PhnB